LHSADQWAIREQQQLKAAKQLTVNGLSVDKKFQRDQPSNSKLHFDEEAIFF
jgi:hypothetical protein